MKRVCNRCGTKVKKSKLSHYKYYCPKHDEDLYEFETEVIEEWAGRMSATMINKIFRTIKWFALTVDRAYFRMSQDRQEEIRNFINENW